MNSKWHLVVSNIKSAVRIVACIAATVTSSVVVLAIGLGIAELLGILEELGDKR
jgi:hypothetical protein